MKNKKRKLSFDWKKTFWRDKQLRMAWKHKLFSNCGDCRLTKQLPKHIQWDVSVTDGNDFVAHMNGVSDHLLVWYFMCNLAGIMRGTFCEVACCQCLRVGKLNVHFIPNNGSRFSLLEADEIFLALKVDSFLELSETFLLGRHRHCCNWFLKFQPFFFESQNKVPIREFAFLPTRVTVSFLSLEFSL